MKMANTSFENVAKFTYLRMRVTNQNYIHEEFKEFVALTEYSSEFLPSHHQLETWSLTLRVEHILSAFENRIKVKVKLFLSSPEHHATKVYWGVEVSSTH
jgi:hypothetical protein